MSLGNISSNTMSHDFTGYPNEWWMIPTADYWHGSWFPPHGGSVCSQSVISASWTEPFWSPRGYTLGEKCLRGVEEGNVKLLNIHYMSSPPFFLHTTLRQKWGGDVTEFSLDHMPFGCSRYSTRSTIMTTATLLKDCSTFTTGNQLVIYTWYKTRASKQLHCQVYTGFSG